MSTCKYPVSVEKWDVFEVEMPGKSTGNPFTDYTIQGTFSSKSETKTVDGFYDGDGVYRVRFMPSFEETYTFTVKGSFSDETFTGSFQATAPSEGNHGPVRVSYTYHFAYEDGKPYYSLGTTCYVWELQSEELQEQTLKTLAEGPFNKIRFCIFPKHYVYNFHDPISFPYEGTPMDSSVLTKMKKKTLADWERYAKIICEKDAYNHLRSIHNCFTFYDHSRPWVTHCSIQRQDIYKTAELVNELRERYHKPVVLDEIAYEGNIQYGWGNISGQEMTRRFWEAFCRGGYPGHGETYMNPDDILWWSHGGVLHGDSPARIKFLQKIMEETPAPGLKPIKGGFDEVIGTVDGLKQPYYIYYYSFMRPSFRKFHIDDETEFKVEVIDTWNMTIEDRGTFKGEFTIDLPGREYMAIRLRKAE